MKKIAILGANGYVGKAFARMVEGRYEVIKYDPALEDSATKEEVNKGVR